MKTRSGRVLDRQSMPNLESLTRKHKRTKVIDWHHWISGPIVYFVSKYAFSMSRETVVSDYLPSGWNIAKRGFVDHDEISTFHPNDYEGLIVSKEEFSKHPDMYTGLTPKKKMSVHYAEKIPGMGFENWSREFHHNPIDSTFLSTPKLYCQNVFVINWGENMKRMIDTISQTSLMECFDILWLISLYASPLSVFVREPRMNTENACWFIGQNDCEDRVLDLLNNEEKTREYFEFLGIENIAIMLVQDSEQVTFLTLSKEEQFERFKKLLDTKKWMSYWLEEHFFLPR